jgi:hypothetical protein
VILVVVTDSDNIMTIKLTRRDNYKRSNNYLCGRFVYEDNPDIYDLECHDEINGQNEDRC